MAVTGIPPYKAEPLALFIRCPNCFLRYLVWTAEQEPSKVEPMSEYLFVDSRKQSVIECPCGDLLPLTEILSSEGVM
jgi:hypothetical protein